MQQRTAMKQNVFLKNNKIKAYLVKIILKNREDTIKISETC